MKTLTRVQREDILDIILGNVLRYRNEVHYNMKNAMDLRALTYPYDGNQIDEISVHLRDVVRALNECYNSISNIEKDIQKYRAMNSK